MGVRPSQKGRAGRPSHNNYQIVSYLILTFLMTLLVIERSVALSLARSRSRRVVEGSKWTFRPFDCSVPERSRKAGRRSAQ